MAGTVTNQTTRITNADAGTWVDHGGGQGSATNTDIFIQGTGTRGRRSDNTTSHGFSFDNTVNIDLSGANEHVGFWYWSTHPAQLNTVVAANPGVLLRIGTSTTNYDGHDALGSDNYGDEGGWRRIWIDISRTPEVTGGTGLNESQARYFGQETSIGNVGGNAPNIMLDSIDYTSTGLLVDSGTVPSPAVFDDYVIADWDNSSNRYGIVQTIQGGTLCYGRLTIADATATIFNDSGFNIVFADQTLCSDTFMGVTIDLQNASTDVDFGSGTIKSGGTTKRGDLIVTGTAGDFLANGTTLDGLRQITLTSAAELRNCLIQNSVALTQSSGTIDNCTITGAVTADGVAFVTSNNPANITNCNFTFSDGHAIEITTAGTYTLDANIFTGYGADGTNDAAIYNNSGGAVTLNILNGGSTPTIRNGAGASTTVNNTVTVRVTALDAADSSAIQDAVVLLEAAAGGDLAVGTDILLGSTNASGIIEDTGFNFTNPQPVIGVVRKGSSSPYYKESPISGTITSAGFITNIFLVSDE